MMTKEMKCELLASASSYTLSDQLVERTLARADTRAQVTVEEVVAACEWKTRLSTTPTTNRWL